MPRPLPCPPRARCNGTVGALANLRTWARVSCAARTAPRARLPGRLICCWPAWAALLARGAVAAAGLRIGLPGHERTRERGSKEERRSERQRQREREGEGEPACWAGYAHGFRAEPGLAPIHRVLRVTFSSQTLGGGGWRRHPCGSNRRIASWAIKANLRSPSPGSLGKVPTDTPPSSPGWAVMACRDGQGRPGGRAS